MTQAGNHTVVAFSQADLSFNNRKMILLKVNSSDFSMSLHILGSNAVPHRMIWSETDGLTIIGNVNNPDGTSAIHLFRVS